MVRRTFLPLMVLAVFSAVTTGSAQAGWGHSSGSSQQGETMSPEPAIPGGTWGTSEHPKEGMETSEYDREESLETGRLPESRGFESGETAMEEIGGRLYRHGVDTGP